jgi:hypothetical protein
MEDDTDDENIRPPDEIKQERLIDVDYPVPSYDLDTILKISNEEFLEQELKSINAICNQSEDEYYKERQHKFDKLKTQLNKIIVIDKENIVYYELVLSIIEMYELGDISEYKASHDEYTYIFKLLKTIRFPSNEMNNLKKIIIY